MSKGKRIERKARKELEEKGWLVDSKPKVKFHSPDLFGHFDLIAIKKGERPKLIQVKSNKKYPSSKLREFAEREVPDCFSCEWWSWQDYKGWVKKKLN